MHWYPCILRRIQNRCWQMYPTWSTKQVLWIKKNDNQSVPATPAQDILEYITLLRRLCPAGKLLLANHQRKLELFHRLAGRQSIQGHSMWPLECSAQKSLKIMQTCWWALLSWVLCWLYGITKIFDVVYIASLSGKHHFPQHWSMFFC